MPHIGKLIVAPQQYIAVIYEFNNGHVSIMNMDAAGYEALDALAYEDKPGVLELQAGNRMAFRVIKGIGDVIQKKLVCTAEALLDSQIALILRQQQTKAGDGESDEEAGYSQ